MMPGAFRFARATEVILHGTAALVRSGTSAKSKLPCSISFQTPSDPGAGESTRSGVRGPLATRSTSPRSIDRLTRFSRSFGIMELLCTCHTVNATGGEAPLV